MSLKSDEVRDAFKYLFPAELPALKELVSWLHPNPVVINIGAGAGTSGLAIMETRSDVTLVTIDVTDKSSPHGCLEAERDVMTRAGFGDQWGVRWFQFHGPSYHFLRHFQGDTSIATLSGDFELWDGAGMVFVDGDHSYYGCKWDILDSLPLLAKNGIIAVHDYLKESVPETPIGPHPKPWPGVTEAVRDYLFSNPSLEPCMHVDSLVAFRVLNNET